MNHCSVPQMHKGSAELRVKHCSGQCAARMYALFIVRVHTFLQSKWCECPLKMLQAGSLVFQDN